MYKMNYTKTPAFLCMTMHTYFYKNRQVYDQNGMPRKWDKHGKGEKLPLHSILFCIVLFICHVHVM